MTAPRKKKRTALPRVTLLAYSRRELARFSEAMEQGVAAAMDLSGAMARLDRIVLALESLVELLPKITTGYGQTRGRRRTQAPPPTETETVSPDTIV